MASFAAALVALLVASCATAAAAMTFVVGDVLGWNLGVDYPDWTSQTFVVGDTLVFNYTSKAHTVTEVNKSDYDACFGGRALSNDDSGATTITLTTAGVHYFICNVQGHCGRGDNGMKFAVNATVLSRTVSTIPVDNAGASLVPATSAVAAAAVGALIKLALF